MRSIRRCRCKKNGQALQPLTDLSFSLSQVAALLGIAMLLLVVYMTTWDERRMAIPIIAVRANISKIKFWKYS